MSEDNNTDTTDTSDDVGIDDTEAQRLLADALESDTDTESDTDWRAEADRLAKEASKWKALARKHEGTARQRSEAASKAQTLEEQVAELRKDMAERDTAYNERYSERSARLAMSQVRTQLAEAGIKPADVTEILEGYDAKALLDDDGEPNDTAISKLAKSLAKVAGRVTPDQDQGRKGGTAPPNMNELIRRAAGMRI